MHELVGDARIVREVVGDGSELIRQSTRPGGVLTAQIAVLDDISRAPGEALNVLFRVLNERRFSLTGSGDDDQVCPSWPTRCRRVHLAREPPTNADCRAPRSCTCRSSRRSPRATRPTRASSTMPSPSTPPISTASHFGRRRRRCCCFCAAAATAASVASAAASAAVIATSSCRHGCAAAAAPPPPPLLARGP